MSHSPSIRSSALGGPASRLAMPGLLLALAVGLASSPLAAGTADWPLRPNFIMAANDSTSAMSGGVGEEEQEAMRQAAATYNVHVMFSDQSGAFLAGIPFVVTRPDGREVHSGVSNGPLLYLKLKPGAYRVGALIDGLWQYKRIAARTIDRPLRLSFVGKAD